jgi:hypothetical protein
MVDLITIRKGPSLVPATAFDLEQIEKVRIGAPLRTTVTFSRSGRKHRFYRALISHVADGLGIAPGLLHAQVKLRCGLIENILISKKAGPIVELKSTAYASMDETEFSAYVDMAIDVLFTEYLPGIKRKDVLAEVDRMVGPSKFDGGVNGTSAE